MSTIQQEKLICDVCFKECTNDDVRETALGEPTDVVCGDCWDPRAHSTDQLIIWSKTKKLVEFLRRFGTNSTSWMIRENCNRLINYEEEGRKYTEADFELIKERAQKLEEALVEFYENNMK
jgi:hypothetical protein